MTALMVLSVGALTGSGAMARSGAGETVQQVEPSPKAGRSQRFEQQSIARPASPWRTPDCSFRIAAPIGPRTADATVENPSAVAAHPMVPGPAKNIAMASSNEAIRRIEHKPSVPAEPRQTGLGASNRSPAGL